MDALTALLLAVIVTATAAHMFQLWVRHQRRVMVHKERLAAIEKGVELPPLEQEIQRGRFNVQRLLLFAGLVWISIGLAAFLILFESAGLTYHIPQGYDRFGNPATSDIMVPIGAHWIALAPIGIGLSHVIVYLVGKNKEMT